MTFVMVSDIVEPNGRTIRENNLARPHDIPLGTLVEVNCDYIDEHGIRLFVVEHQRDCDGSPLYGLSWMQRYVETGDDVVDRIRRFQISGGYGDDCLIVIAPPKDIEEG